MTVVRHQSRTLVLPLPPKLIEIIDVTETTVDHLQ
jgi:hypothetical protein